MPIWKYKWKRLDVKAPLKALESGAVVVGRGERGDGGEDIFLETELRSMF